MKCCTRRLDPFDNPHDAREDRYKYESLPGEPVEANDLAASEEYDEASHNEEANPYDFEFDFGT